MNGDWDLVLNACDAKRENLGFDSLNSVEQVLTCISVARFEIQNGGLTQFYYNSSGGFSLETVWAFEQIGALQWASILRRANSFFPDAVPSFDREERWEQMKEISLDAQLEQLTYEF